jgi:hypothetical protein
MTRNELEKNLQVNGWRRDRFGHWHMHLNNGNEFRIKMQKTSVRFERKVDKLWFNRSMVPIYYHAIEVKTGSTGLRCLTMGTKLVKMENEPCM